MDTDSPREVFFRVASEMFSDGNFNWGRVVALFYFASKLVLKVRGHRVVGPGLGGLPSSLPDLGVVRSTPVAAHGDQKQIAFRAGCLLDSFIHSTDVRWAYHVPGLSPRTQHCAKQARSPLSKSPPLRASAESRKLG